jgi:two-component system OmpR family response regulator
VKRILVVDDDPHLRDVVVYTLEREGYAVRTAADGRAALALFEGIDASDPPFDLVVLDVLMPEIDGREVCRRLRGRSRIPIVFLSSRDEELDKILGLELGGDDYVTKPFSPRELAARVKAVLRRAEGVASVAAHSNDARESIVRRAGPIVLDASRHEVRCGDQPLKLTVTEFGVLATLMEQPGRVFTRAQLMERAYAYDNLITERTIDTHVKRIRKKFRDAGHDPVETVHGLGYKLRV